MDSEHRHELKTNELAEGLAHLPELIKKNANTIIGVALIAVALITWPMFNKMSDQKETAEMAAMTQSIQLLEKDMSDVINAPEDDPQAKVVALNTMLVNIDALLDKAADCDYPDLAAMAQIKAAQAIRMELHLRSEVDAEMLETQIGKAQDTYNQAYTTANSATLKAMAQFGLGLCSEELGQADQAAEIYQQIISEETYTTTVLPTLAQKRIDNLDENAETFTFADVPVEIEAPIEIEDLPTEAIEDAAAKPQETPAEPAPEETPEPAVETEPDADTPAPATK